MEEKVWKKIIDESAGRGVIYRPFLVNEPFADNRLAEIIAYIHRDPTAKVELNSNANFPKRKVVDETLEAGVDIIRFSLDGFSQETYAASGRGTRYEKMVDNIHYFIDVRNRLKRDCFIEVRMVGLDLNKHEQQDYLNYWNKHADIATITPLYSWPWTGQTEPYNAPCPKIVDEMFFIVDGRAVLCCWDFHERGVVGDIKEQSVEEIWLGGQNQEFRSILDTGQRDKIELCSRCDAYKNYDFSGWKSYDSFS
jgi:radical SAM protein with 4Fe4S-binding SPASM domain